jgi:aminoglycoside phosphotransferase (APT) family kinase protein
VSLLTLDDIPVALRAYTPPGASLSYPRQGMTSEVAFVDGPRPCVIKRCRDPIYLEWLAREHSVLLALAGSPLPVPRVLAYAPVDAQDARREAWLVMSRLPGRPLWPEMIEADSGRRAALLRRVGELLKRVHATPVPPGLRSPASWIDRMLEQARENLKWCDGTPALLEDLHRRRPAAIPEVLIHGDLALDNVLIAADDVMSLIDWSGGAQGDPRCDLALALLTEPEFALGETELAAFYDGYGRPALNTAARQWFADLYEFF